MGDIAPSRPMPRLIAAASAAALITLGSLAAAPAATAESGAPAATATAAAAQAPAEAPVHSERTVIDVGHVDAISPRMVGGAFRTLLLDDREALAPVWRTPGSVILHLTQAGAVTISDDTPGFFFLGAPGTTIHTIPQTQDPDVIWAGWSTQSFTSDDVRGDMRLTLEGVDGPGDVVLWEWSPFGEPEMVIDGRAGLPASYPVPTFTHQHANWAFTRPGVYRLKFTWSADLVKGGTVSDTAVYTFAVGDLDTSAITLPGDGATPTPDPTGTTPTPDPTTTTPAPTASTPATTPPATTGTPTGTPSATPSVTATATTPAGGGTATTPPAPSPGAGANDPSPQSGSRGALAATGSSQVLPTAAAGAALVAAGAVAVVAVRRRSGRPGARP
ncbi:MAG: choice-of-anchor M domain-containing protein [Actinomycetia bacterium]|nr:choice-of-anchor M domain-containing protein [Actinomycetes bacterium]